MPDTRNPYGSAGGQIYLGDPGGAGNLGAGWSTMDPRYFEQYVTPGSEGGGGEVRYRLRAGVRERLAGRVQIGDDDSRLIDPSKWEWDPEFGRVTDASNYRSDDDNGWAPWMVAAIPALAMAGGAMAGVGPGWGAGAGAGAGASAGGAGLGMAGGSGAVTAPLIDAVAPTVLNTMAAAPTVGGSTLLTVGNGLRLASAGLSLAGGMGGDRRVVTRTRAADGSTPAPGPRSATTTTPGPTQYPIGTTAPANPTGRGAGPPVYVTAEGGNPAARGEGTPTIGLTTPPTTPPPPVNALPGWVPRNLVTFEDARLQRAASGVASGDNYATTGKIGGSNGFAPRGEEYSMMLRQQNAARQASGAVNRFAPKGYAVRPPVVTPPTPPYSDPPLPPAITPPYGDPYLGGNGNKTGDFTPPTHGDTPIYRYDDAQRDGSNGFADGGQIVGPGGPRDDNLLIRASDGEVVVPADVVRAKGTDFFDKLKEGVRTKAIEKHGPSASPGFAGGAIPMYADGGLVSIEDYGQPLETSASPGLEALPAQGMIDASPAFSDPALVAEPPGAAPPPQPMLSAAPATSGLGLADFKAARNTDDSEYLKSLPTMQKIGLLLQSYQAGVEGRPNPFDSLLESKRKREAEFRAEFGTTIQTIKAGTELVSKLPPGKARDAAIEQIARAAGPNRQIVFDALTASGTDRQKDIEDVISVIENPRARAMLERAVSGSPEPRKEVQKLLADADYMKRLEAVVDQETLPALTTKMKVLSRTMEKMEQFKDGEGKVAFSMADLREQNAQLPKEFQLSSAELNTAARNQATLIPYGLKTDKSLQDDQSADAKRKEAGPLSAIGKLNDDLKNKKITKDQFVDEIRRMNLSVERKDAAAAAGPGYTDEQVDTLARQAMKDKSVLFNIGRGAQGARDLQAINKRMADIMREEGGAGTAEQRATFAADKKSLDKLVPQLDAVEAFSANAVQQGKVLKGLAKKVDTTGVPVVERWIRAGRRQIAGDADVSEFNAQLQLYRTEAARIVVNPNLTGVLTDTARKEVQHFLDGDATAPQIIRVVDRLENDFSIRHRTLQEQIDQVKARMSGGAKADDKPAAAPAAAKGDAVPAGIPAGSKHVGFAKGSGKKVWQDPTGKKWVE